MHRLGRLATAWADAVSMATSGGNQCATYQQQQRLVLVQLVVL
jgi:hypothetical protein